MVIYCKYGLTMELAHYFGTAALNNDAMLHATPANCPNCFAETSGNYCHQCSQETTLHPPSAREFLHEFIGHYVALEGKLWQSLWLLLLKPGRLTLEYLHGRRVRYVQPLRLYLTFSLIFFALVKFSGLDFIETEPVHAPPAIGRPAATTTVSNADNEIFQQAGQLAERLHAGWGQRVATFLALPQRELAYQLSKTFFSYAPYALFALMPVFALLLKLLYLGSGRRYGAHLLFALHANALAFALLALQIVVPSGWGFVHFVMLAWMVLYLPLALQRVYGGRWPVTLLRWIVLTVLHCLCIALAIAATLGSAFIA